MHTSLRPSAATCCASHCLRFVSTQKVLPAHREQAVRVGKAARTARRGKTVVGLKTAPRMKAAARPKTVARLKIGTGLKIRAHPANRAVRREVRPELVRAAAAQELPAGARRYGCCVTASWVRCGATPVSTMDRSLRSRAKT